jgi:hypothetical protein
MTEEAKIPSATKHGGQGALRRIQDGREFTGLARIAEQEVEDRLASEGIEGELERDARRLQVVSDLYYGAFINATEEHDTDRATGYLKVWCWVHNSAVRAWTAAAKYKKAARQGNVVDAALAELTAYRQPATTDHEAQNAPDN